MTTAKERVVEERKELNIKIDKLIEFRTTAIYESLSKQMQDLLLKQEVVMQEYLDILDARLKCWEEQV